MSGTTRPRRPHPVAAAATLAAAAALVLSGCSSADSTDGGDGKTGFVTAKNSTVSTAAPGHRQDAPDIGGRTLEGTPARLADYRGKVVVLNVWGSWCSPCRSEADDLQRVWEKYRDQGVQFLGINTRDNQVENAVRFEQEKGVTFPSLYDPAGEQLLKFPKGTLNPQSIPTTIVVDRDGKLAARAVGGQTDDALESMLQPIVAERKQ